LPDSNIFSGPIICVHEDTLYALANLSVPDGSFGELLLSTDNGAVWSGQTYVPHGFDEEVYSVHESGSSTQILSADWGNQIFSTMDFGQAWTALTPLPQDVHLTTVSQTDQAIYAYSDFYPAYLLYQSSDGGSTWTVLQPPGANGNRLVVVGDEVFVDAQTSCLNWSNETWDTLTALPFGGQNVYWEMIRVPGNPARLVGLREDSSALWVSENDGQSWIQHDIAYPYPGQSTRWSNLTYDQPRQRLWVCAGIGACYLDAAELKASGPLHLKPADFTVLSAYPNPFNPVTRIRFDLEKRGRVKVDVYDLQGRLVKTLVNGIQESGRHEVSFDGSALASGTYFVRLRSLVTTRTEKILLLK
jgi:hypothetical protein